MLNASMFNSSHTSRSRLVMNSCSFIIKATRSFASVHGVRCRRHAALCQSVWLSDWLSDCLTWNPHRRGQAKLTEGEDCHLGWVRSQPGRCGHAVGYCVEYYHRTRANFFIQVPTRPGARLHSCSGSMNEVALDGIHNTLHSNWHLSQHPGLALAMSKLYVSAGASISHRGFGAHSRLAPHLRFMRMCRGTIRDACVNSAGWCAFHEGPVSPTTKSHTAVPKGPTVA
jgi:hypothetical protein